MTAPRPAPTIPARRRARRLAAAVLPALALLAACQGPADPYAAEGRWRPTGANEANLRAMVADPADLARGRDAVRRDAEVATAAVARLRADRVRPLPRNSTSAVGTEEGGGNGR